MIFCTISNDKLTNYTVPQDLTKSCIFTCAFSLSKIVTKKLRKTCIYVSYIESTLSNWISHSLTTDVVYQQGVY